MLKEKLLKIKEQITKNGEGNNKRKIENLIVFLVILIVTIISINLIWNTNKKEQEKEKDTSKKLATVENTMETDEIQANDIEKKLENILAKINGVGEVNVLITYSESSTIVPVYNEDSKQTSTKETDTRRRN